MREFAYINVVIICMMGNLYVLLESSDLFSSEYFFEKSFRNTIKVPNGLYPAQDLKQYEVS